MLRFHAPLLLAGLLPFALGVAAQERGTARAPGDRAAAFDQLFHRLDSEELKPATPEEAQAQLARLRALIPPGDARRELQFRSLACFQPPEDAAASLEVARRGVLEARQRGDAEAEARFTYCQAGFAEMTQGPRPAIDLYTQGLGLARRAEVPLLVGDGLVARGNVRSYIGQHALALADFIAAQRVYEAAGLRANAESNLQNIGIAYRRMGEFERARRYLEQAREIALRQQDWAAVLVHWLQIGYLHEDMGEPDRALAAYDEALRVARQRLGPGDAGAAELGIASARITKGEPTAALAALARARADFASINDTSNAGMLALLEGQAHAALGRDAVALEAFARAEQAFRRERNERYLAMLYPERAKVLERMGRPADALDDYKRYVTLREKLVEARTDQRTLMLRQQFDARQRELENAQLRREKVLREQRVAALERARRWQVGAILLGGVLFAMMAGFAVRQFVRARRLRVLALTDELTGVANRRRIELVAEEAVAVALAHGRPLCLITFDIDYFKRINDSFGHLAGDEVIARVADACQQALRQNDAIGRTGGEEFLVVLPDTGIEAATQVGERLRSNVEALRWHDVAPDLQVTVSLGVATLRADDSSVQDVLRRADAALYRAKAAGRNTLQTAD
ncbi:tetratricopeptide repeat-containing diguanylate cyclase [Lysobacter sp. N42]|uniref:tetratricopeptide repeat-containing diguanylate cyclase n=1 Tax=Lysobacter sp. N42 TaxID=2545719 RepID=UPI0010516A4B|nr:tetratricopeptide repeat-containing diguanylate cyclase [Lysobacter sp. N42]TCZ78549.1 diguanylate cyclase [Lysobacter sp. N42]